MTVLQDGAAPHRWLHATELEVGPMTGFISPSRVLTLAAGQARRAVVALAELIHTVAAPRPTSLSPPQVRGRRAR